MQISTLLHAVKPVSSRLAGLAVPLALIYAYLALPRMVLAIGFPVPELAMTPGYHQLTLTFAVLLAAAL